MAQYRIKGVPSGARFWARQSWISASTPPPASDGDDIPEPTDGRTPDSEATVQVIAIRNSGVSPAGMAFEAVTTGWNVERPSEDLRYEWDFGDIGSQFDVLGDRVPTLWGRSANTAYLDKVFHTFAPDREDFADGQGGYLAELTYTVRCTVTDGTISVETSLDVTIENPDFVFQGSRTVIVARDGDHGGAPADVFGRGYTLATSLPGRNALMNRRVLLKRGETYAEASVVFDGGGSHYMLGAWGTGARPVLERAEGTIIEVLYDNARVKAGSEVSIWGVHLQSIWNPVTESWMKPLSGLDSANGINLKGGTDDLTTIHDCYIAGCHQGLISSGKTNPDQFIVISNTEITDWRNFGIILSGSKYFGMLGCRVEQNPDALGGGSVPQSLRGTHNDQNIHGPIRIGNPSPLGYSIISMTEMMSNCGWSSGNGAAGPVLTTDKRPSHQPCLRFNTSSIEGAVLRMDRVVGEGGNAVFNATGFGAPDRTIPCDIIMDKMVAISNANNAGSSFGAEHAGFVLRNFLIVVPPAPNGWELEPGGSLMGYGDADGSYTAEALAGGYSMYSGTVLDWSNVDKTFASSNFINGEDPDVTISNVLFHAPNYSVSLDNSGSVSLSRLFAPIYKGYKWENRHKNDGATYIDAYGNDTGTPNSLAGVPDSPTLDTRFATLDTFDQDGVTVSTVSLLRPLAGVLPANLEADAKVALDDLFGRLRGPQPSTGAIEP